MARVEFDHLARFYDAARAIEAGGLVGWRDALSRHLPEQTALPVLDVGCGTGSFTTLIAEWFDLDVVGVEPSQAMLHEARSRRSHPRVSYLEGRAEHLPVGDHTCGAAWLSTVIQHIGSLELCAHELARVLAPTGRILIRSSFPGRHEHITLFRYFPGAAAIASSFPTVEDTVTAFARAGFEREAFESVEQLTSPSLAAARDRVALRADTTLELLADEEFAAGLARLDADIASDPSPRPVLDRLDLLVLRRSGGS